jgi:hypothetical protein
MLERLATDTHTVQLIFFFINGKEGKKFCKIDETRRYYYSLLLIADEEKK